MANELPFAHRFIIQNLPDIGIITTDKENIIVDINSVACQYIVKRECQEFIGRELFSIIYAQERLKPYHEKIQQVEHSLLDLQDSASFEMELSEEEELERQFFRVTIKVVRELTTQNIQGFIYIVQNISLEKEMELLLRKNIDFKDSLLSVISHDMKNQLMVIQGFTDVLRSELAELEKFSELEEYLNGINAKTYEMQTTITDIRSYLKTLGTFEEEKELAIVDIREEVNYVIFSLESAIRSKNIRLNVVWPEEHDILTRADVRLRSVFNNLLDNAIKWSPPNGSVKIAIERTRIFWLCSIEDHGPGVPNDLKEEIFKPFKGFGSGDKVGSGLGLSITSEILQSYKSSIWIEDVIPHGARFLFRLPIVEKKAEDRDPNLE